MGKREQVSIQRQMMHLMLSMARSKSLMMWLTERPEYLKPFERDPRFAQLQALLDDLEGPMRERFKEVAPDVAEAMFQTKLRMRREYDQG